MPREPGVLAVFSEPAAAAKAVTAARAAGLKDIRAAMPAPFPEVMEALVQRRSVIGAITLGGAVVGMGLGLWLTIGTSLAQPPIVSLPAFLVIVFELTVLVGGLSNFIGMLAGAYVGRRKSWMPKDPRFLRDRIGVFLPGAPSSARALLRAAGAEEVSDVA
jgi:hypothetical protein